MKWTILNGEFYYKFVDLLFLLKYNYGYNFFVILKPKMSN